MPNRLVNSRLAAKTGVRQVDAVLRADAAASAADRAVTRWWRQLLALLRTPGLTAWNVRQLALPLLRGLHAAAHAGIADALTRLVKWGHRSARDALTGTLPVAHLRAAALRRLTDGGVQHNGPRQPRLESAGGARRAGGVALPEVRSRGNGVGAAAAPRHHEGVSARLREAAPGSVELALTALGLEPRDLAAPLREPARQALSAEQQKKALADLLFPAPSPDLVRHIVYAPAGGQSWGQRLANASRLASAETLAHVLAGSLAAGKSQREVAKDLLPHVEGVRSTARRLARTEGLRVASAVQHAAHEELGDMLVGYQIHATLDSHTRPEHAHRNGTIYYKEPKAGQKGLNEMPHPPLEADGSYSWNCRCWTSPVLEPLEDVTNGPEQLAVFTNASDRLIPDPATYSDWFDRADEKRRRVAVGARRYSAVRDVLGADPRWEDFIDPDTGSLLGVAALKSEPDAARTERVAKVRAEIARREALIRQVATLGFEMPQKPPAAVQKTATAAQVLAHIVASGTPEHVTSGRMTLKQWQAAFLPDEKYVLIDAAPGALRQPLMAPAGTKVAAYAKQPATDAPPVVVAARDEDAPFPHWVVDGNHRLEVARLRGDVSIRAWVPARFADEIRAASETIWRATPASPAGPPGSPLDDMRRAAVAWHQSAAAKADRTRAAAALLNAGIDPQSGAVTRPRDARDLHRILAQELVFGLKPGLSDAGHAALTGALRAGGVEQIGKPGQRVAFAGRLHDGPGLFQGDDAVVVEPGWLIRDEDGEYLLARAKVRPA